LLPAIGRTATTEGIAGVGISREEDPRERGIGISNEIEKRGFRKAFFKMYRIQQGIISASANSER